MSEESWSIERRFSSLQRLYGDVALQKLHNIHIWIAGIGGVGSWLAEALVRCGVGEITLVDLDHIAESNINRQVHALGSTLGQAKIEAMKIRMLDINPNCTIHTIDDFVEASNIASYLDRNLPTILVDCTDQVNAKIAMLLASKAREIPFLMCGGAGGKTDVFSLRSSDLSQVKNDNLLGRIRQVLRKEHGFPKGSDSKGRALKKAPKMHVNCVWFDQAAQLPDAWQTSHSPQGLSCSGYGSSVIMTASMGLAVANLAIQLSVES